MSVKMVKEQGLSLNPSKLAGKCGRLKCCMRYEYQTYVELKRTLPAVGAMVESIKGNGKVVAPEHPEADGRRSGARATAAAPRRRSKTSSCGAPMPDAAPSDLLHDAALLRERRAAPRPHLHADRRRHAGALLAGARARRVFVVTGTDEHGDKIAQAAAKHGVEPKAYADRMSVTWPDTWRSRRPAATTTSSARPIRATRRSSRRSSPRSTRAATSTSTATRASTATAASASTRSASSTDGALPRPPHAADRDRGGELLLPHGASTRSGCCALLDEQPELIVARRLSTGGAGAAARADRRPLHLAAEDRASRGASSCRSTTATSPTSGSTRC